MDSLDKSLSIRKLIIEDYGSGYLDLLSELTETPSLTISQFKKQFDLINNNPLINIYVISDGFKIIASITLVIEPKFIHGASSVAHIEDVVVSSTCRGSGLGKKLILYGIQKARDFNCYKIILDCNSSNVSFYEKCGLSVKDLQMVKYL